VYGYLEESRIHKKDVAWGSVILQEQLNPRSPEGMVMLALNLFKGRMQLGAILAAMLILSMAFVLAVSAQGANEQTKVEKPGKIMTPDGRYTLNESDFDKAVIESGTVKIPKTSSIAERINATKKVMDQLSVKIKAPEDEGLDTLCDYTAEECTYRIAKLVKASPLQTIYYFTALANGNDILQPVLEWGQAGRNYWDIASWYGNGGNYSSGQYYRVNVGDSIYGYVQLQTGQPTHSIGITLR
jgi:hypothetical protein